jgi:hypothetical protein
VKTRQKSERHSSARVEAIPSGSELDISVATSERKGETQSCRIRVPARSLGKQQATAMQHPKITPSLVQHSRKQCGLAFEGGAEGPGVMAQFFDVDRSDRSYCLLLCYSDARCCIACCKSHLGDPIDENGGAASLLVGLTSRQGAGHQRAYRSRQDCAEPRAGTQLLRPHCTNRVALFWQAKQHNGEIISCDSVQFYRCV